MVNLSILNFGQFTFRPEINGMNARVAFTRSLLGVGYGISINISPRWGFAFLSLKIFFFEFAWGLKHVKKYRGL